MKKVLLDTNIILDIALCRKPFFELASQIFDKIDSGAIEGYITASSVTDIFYILKKSKGSEKARDFILDLTDIVMIAGLSKETIIDALRSDFKDVEDAVQCYAAIEANIDIILTRNEFDFKCSPIPIYTPNKFLGTF